MPDLLLEPFGGLAGDMFLGALIDLGADVEAIRVALGSLGLPEWRLDVAATERRHLGSTKATFEIPPEKGHRHLPEILQRIAASSLPGRARDRASAAFRALAEAEAKVHRIPVEKVHFHEVGAADAILDVCAVATALELLGVDAIYSTPLPGGSGTVMCDHGELPCPVPAVVELMAGRFELLAGVGRGEMVTPTGAALLAALGAPLPAGLRHRALKTGYGAGTRASSVVRATLIETATASAAGRDVDEVVVLEFQVDDQSPEQLGFLMERAFESGALDLFHTPVFMKKGRPGVAVTLIARPDDEAVMLDLLFAESSTLGVRRRVAERVVLPRRHQSVDTPWGPVRIKLAGEGAAPEYEDCATIARREGVPLREVMARAMLALGPRDRGSDPS